MDISVVVAAFSKPNVWILE